MLVTLLFETIFKPINSSLTYSYAVYPVWIIAILSYIFTNLDTCVIKKNIWFFFFISILIFSVFLGSIRILVFDEYIEQFLFNIMGKSFPKILYIILFYIAISNMTKVQIMSIINSYVFIFFITIFLSLLVFLIFPQERFVFYIEGSVYRFAAFHFELVNFAYSAMIASIILAFKLSSKRGGEYKVFPVFVLLTIFSYVIYYVTYSNYIPIFIFSILTLFLVYFKSKFTLFLLFCYFVILLLLIVNISYFMSFVDEISLVFPRASASGNSDGGPIFYRLYRHIVAIDVFWADILSLPFGIFNGGIEVASEDLLVQRWSGGSGLSKIFMDLGLLVVPFLLILVFSILAAFKRVKVGCKNDMVIFAIINLSFIYVYLQSGFFNFTVTGMFLLSLRYFRLI